VAKKTIHGAYAATDSSADEASTSPSSYASFFLDNTPEILSSCLSVGSGYFSLDLDGSMLFTTSSSDSSTCQGVPYFMNDDRSTATDSPSKNHHNSIRTSRTQIIQKLDRINPGNYATKTKGDGAGHGNRSPSSISKSMIRPKSPTFLAPTTTDTVFSRSHASYMRVSDIYHVPQSNVDLATNSTTTHTSTTTSSSSDHNDKERYTHYNHASDIPPPGLRYDSNELWIAIDNGHSMATPIAIQAIGKLVQTLCHNFAMNANIWTLEKKSETIVPGAMHGWTIDKPLDARNIPPPGSTAEQEVLVWTGILDPDASNSDSPPPVRSESIINMSPETLFDLLLDSSRVHEYNKTSLGRKDLVILHNDLKTEGPFGKSITKIVTSMNKIPLLLKSLEFVTLLHGEALDNDAGYVLVSRAVVRDGDVKAKSEGVLRSEILSGVNLMLRIQHDPNRCVMITANHVRSPFLPSIIAKRLGVSAAIGFVHDIRNCCRFDT